MAPELLEGRKYDLNVDIWSMGVILFMMLTGQMFINCRTDSLTKKKLLKEGSEKDRINSKVCNHLSADAKSFLLTCLERDPDKR